MKGAPTRNLENIDNKQADQPAQQGAANYCIHFLPLLNCCTWKKSQFKMYEYARFFCALLWTA
jgi:hypothetical protein